MASPSSSADPPRTAAERAAGSAALVSNYLVERHCIDAIAAGVPKWQVQQWVFDCARDFFIRDNATFEMVWNELRRAWETKEQRRERRRLAKAPKRPQQSGGGGPRLPCKRQKTEAATCAAAAAEDVQTGVCTSYEQALVVRLVLALGADAPSVWAEALAAGKRILRAQGVAVGEATEGEASTLKKLMLLVHPDKTVHCPTVHPQAKEAFQKLALALRSSREQA